MKNCVVCESSAEVYCFNDDAFLCVGCDEQVHSANVLARKHQRVKVCELCCASPAAIFCKNDNAHLCSACDVSSHAGVVTSRHQRVPVGPHAHEGNCCNAESSKVGDEESQVCHDCTEDSMFAVPDVPIVPPGVEDFPDWNAVSGPLDAKSLLGKEFEQDLDIFDMDPTWLDRLDMGFDDLTQGIIDGVVPEFNDHFFKGSAKDEATPGNLMLNPDLSFDDADFLTQHVSARPAVHEEYKPALPATLTTSPNCMHHLQGVSSSVPEWMPYREAEPQDILSFIPPSFRPVDAQTLLDRAADRNMRLARYREKKKNRQFKKTIRYASRKAYAEVRPRVKGRFARKDEVAAMRAAGMLPCA